MTIINSKTPGKLSVLIIDVTNNANGFENQTSEDIHSAMKKEGVSMVSDIPILVDSIEGYIGALRDYSSKFNTLLLIAHGGDDTGDGKVSNIDGPTGISEWYSMAAVSDFLNDKFIALCVCHGYCEDAISAFLHDGPSALSLLAPTKDLSVDEALAFFPAFFKDLSQSSLNSIDPNEIRAAMNSNNHLSNKKMRLYSDGLSC